MSGGQCVEYLRTSWLDHSSHWMTRRRFLVSDSEAVVLTSFIAVVVTLTGTRLWVLISALLRWSILQAFPNIDPRPEAERVFHQAIRLEDLPNGAGRPHFERPVEEALWEYSRSSTDFGASLRAFRDAMISIVRRKWSSRDLLLQLALASMCLTLFASITLGGIFSSSIILGDTAICKSTSCGYWTPQDMDNMDSTTWVTNKKIKLQTQDAAAILETRCYKNHTPTEDCDSTIPGAINYEVRDGSQCPFQGDVCLNGTNSAFTLDTGFRPVSLLGINSPCRLDFRRRMDCAPLVVNSSYAEHVDPENKYSRTRYKYGSISFGDFGPNVTAEVPVPFDSLVPYSSTYYMSIADETSDFQPLPEFMSDLGDVSIMFVMPRNIIYVQPSYDPIFPAADRIKYFNDTYWLKLSPFATALGCTNSFEICNPELEECVTQDWDGTLSPFLGELTGESLDDAFATAFLTFASLSAGNMYQTIGLRGASALKAATLIDRESKKSNPLDPEQWKLEVRQIFETSLLRSQLELVGIVGGVGAEEPGFKNSLADSPIWPRICDMVKVKASGHKSVSVWAIVLTMACCLVVALLSINPEGKLVVLHFSGRLLRYMKRILGMIYVKTIGVAKVGYHWCANELSKFRRRRGRITLD